MGLDKTQPRATKLRLAVVGCGAIAEQGHLPAALQVQEVQVTALVDKNTTRANDWWRHEEGLIAFQNEWVKLPYYWLKY
jgi:predicted dehydrogenase